MELIFCKVKWMEMAENHDEKSFVITYAELSGATARVYYST
jgi:hypothetical protein